METKLELIKKITENGVIAVIRQIPKEKVIQVAESLIDGGVNVLEVTVDSDDAFQIMERLSHEFKDRSIIGAGTVLESLSAEAAIRSGAEFIVSPILRREVIKTTLLHGKISIPGIMTPTEMVEAQEQSADIVKFFPASVGGPEFIKNVKGPLPHIQIIATGGVDLQNASEFIKAGAAAIGVGGNLVDKSIISEGSYEKLTMLAKEYVDKVKGARENS